MARISSVIDQIEPELKGQAEAVLSRLGIFLSNAASMFLRQAVLQRGIPSPSCPLACPKRPSGTRRVTVQNSSFLCK